MIVAGPYVHLCACGHDVDDHDNLDRIDPCRLCRCNDYVPHDPTPTRTGSAMPNRYTPNDPDPMPGTNNYARAVGDAP